MSLKNSKGIGAKTNNSASRFYWRSTGREPVHYEICERFAPIFLRQTHVNYHRFNIEIQILVGLVMVRP
ncbi:hypothetical protein LEP1GSC021_0843 [Leptospira noguchii str. 1993005606]|nr:hypothetical protein LEP1GSC021_0843 [Leptospira noguchii str. 1993005606]